RVGLVTVRKQRREYEKCRGEIPQQSCQPPHPVGEGIRKVVIRRVFVREIRGVEDGGEGDDGDWNYSVSLSPMGHSERKKEKSQLPKRVRERCKTDGRCRIGLGLQNFGDGEFPARSASSLQTSCWAGLELRA